MILLRVAYEDTERYSKIVKITVKVDQIKKISLFESNSSKGRTVQAKNSGYSQLNIS